MEKIVNHLLENTWVLITLFFFLLFLIRVVCLIVLELLKSLSFFLGGLSFPIIHSIAGGIYRWIILPIECFSLFFIFVKGVYDKKRSRSSTDLELLKILAQTTIDPDLKDKINYALCDVSKQSNTLITILKKEIVKYKEDNYRDYNINLPMKPINNLKDISLK